MKKLFLVIAALAVSVSLSAQKKGDMYISGSFSITGSNTNTTVNNTSTKAPNSTTFSIEPSYGYFVIDRLEVNLGLGYSLNKTRRSTDRDGNHLFSRQNVFEITPGVRYYIPICDKFYYTPGFNFSVGFGNQKSDIDKDTVNKKGVTEFGLALSVVAFEIKPCEHFGITLRAGSLSYSLDKVSEKSVNSSTTNNSVSFGLNTGAGIGFKYYF